MSLALLEVEGDVATLTINRPDKYNALNPEVMAALSAAIDEASEKKVRCLILTGAGKAFVAGADIGAMQSMSRDEAASFARAGHDLGIKMEATPYPIIAAINGFALGGGCELAMCCDFSYASTKAKLGQPEVKLGVIPGFGGTQRMLRRVGSAMARELVYTGKMIDAHEALRIGLVNAVFEPDALMDEAKKSAAMIASMGPVAVQHAKRVILEGADVGLQEGNDKEIEAFADCFLTSDQKEGMAAFIEKREAEFEGK